MKVIIQRCSKASVSVDGKIIGKINKGMVLLVGFTHQDSSKEIDYMVDKIVNLRIFDDDNGVMNKSILDIDGDILSISQFTLYANTNSGRRPSYVDAMKAEKATYLYDEFNNKLKNVINNVETGIFGADMKVELINDGPVTIIIERGDKDGK